MAKIPAIEIDEGGYPILPGPGAPGVERSKRWPAAKLEDRAGLFFEQVDPVERRVHCGHSDESRLLSITQVLEVLRSLTERKSMVTLSHPKKWRCRRCADPKRQRENRP
jgi:hypothetical protein